MPDVWMQILDNEPEQVQYEPMAIATKLRAGYRQVSAPGEPPKAPPEVPTFPPQPEPEVKS